MLAPVFSTDDTPCMETFSVLCTFKYKNLPYKDYIISISFFYGYANILAQVCINFWGVYVLLLVTLHLVGWIKYIKLLELFRALVVSTKNLPLCQYAKMLRGKNVFLHEEYSCIFNGDPSSKNILSFLHL